MFSPTCWHVRAILLISTCVLALEAMALERFAQSQVAQNGASDVSQSLLEAHLTVYVESVQITLTVRQPEFGDGSEPPTGEPPSLSSYRSDSHTHNVVAISISLTPSRTSDKAQAFMELIEHYARVYNQEPALILAIMHSESSFNPEARSRIPAIGLMQIVPQSAGRDITRILYGEAQVMPSSYYIDPENSVRAGVVYLDLLMRHYLRHIEHPESRLYAAVAAYNTGAGNVARAFTGTTSIKDAAAVINQMTPEAVYTHLIENLPYDETRHYLGHVIALQMAYRDWYPE